VKCLTVAFSVGLLAKIHDPFPASQERFQQFRVIELFALKAATRAVIVGHSSNDFEIF